MRPRQVRRRDRLASRGETLSAFSAIVLSISAFTGWYSGKVEGLLAFSILGWDTGTLGKLVFFIGLAVLLVLALGATGLELPPTFPAGAVAAALGTLATIFVLVRVIDLPDELPGLGRSVGLWISLAAGVAVIATGLFRANEEIAVRPREAR